MILPMFFPRYLVWLDLRWPFIHVRKGHCVQQAQKVVACDDG